MAETDLEGVSANTGDNILSIFGASAAGIEIDETEIELEKENHQESAEVLPRVNNDLLEDDQQIDGFGNESIQPSISDSSASEILRASESATRTAATSGLTTSETRYKTENFNHESTFINSESVQMDRDLFIDRLAIENLSGDGLDEGRSAGSITISNWRSLGQTTITSE